MAVVTLNPKLQPVKPRHALCGFGAQFNTNLFTSVGRTVMLTEDELDVLRANLAPLKLGHSRIFVRATARGPGRERDALMSTLELARTAGANVNLTWWKGPFPHEPESNHAQKRKKLMEDFAGIIEEARGKPETDCVTHLTIMNEVNSYDIAKALKPQKTMELYNLLYHDLHDSLNAIRDPKDPSKPLRDSVDLVGGDLVELGPKAILVDNKPRKYGPSDQSDWLKFMRNHMADVLDGYSVHIYWAPGRGRGGFPLNLERRLADVGKLGIEKPVYVTEYGVRQLEAKPRPGTFDGSLRGTPMERSPGAAFQHAWFNALAPHYGFVGLAKWVLYKTTNKGEFGGWGMIGPAHGQSEPFRPYPTSAVTQLYNHLVGPQWTADCFGRSSDRSLLMSRFKGPGGGQSAVVLNMSRSRSQQVRIEGLQKNRPYAAAEWNRDGKGTVHELPPKKGGATLKVPAYGLVALSTNELPE
jgi:hypothetical protein